MVLLPGCGAGQNSGRGAADAAVGAGTGNSDAADVLAGSTSTDLGCRVYCSSNRGVSWIGDGVEPEPGTAARAAGLSAAVHRRRRDSRACDDAVAHVGDRNF